MTDSLNQSAKMLYEVESKNAEAALGRMLRLEEQLVEQYNRHTTSAKKASEAFAADKTEQNLKILTAEVGKLGFAMRDLKTVGGKLTY